MVYAGVLMNEYSEIENNFYLVELNKTKILYRK